MMDDKTKRRGVRRRAITPISDMGEGSSPTPNGPGSEPDCGHGGCGPHCAVRYVGPTSHIRDHHIMHAAQGVAHIWSAAVVTGLAVVLTGAIAYSSVEAKTDLKAVAAQQEGTTRGDWIKIMNRLDEMERALGDVKQLCTKAEPALTTDQKIDKVFPEKKPAPKPPETSATVNQ